MSKKRTRFIDVNILENIVHETKTFKEVKAVTRNQRDFLKSIYENDLVIGVGPQGTGKTHISSGAAIKLLMEDKIEKVTVTRATFIHPEDEIGFAPGSLTEKMMPFLLPIYKEFEKFVSKKVLQELISDGKLDIIPFAYLRGVNLEGMVCLEEAQNCSFRQMKLLISRMCKGSKFIISGDLGQSDIPLHKQGALEWLINKLHGHPGVGICHLEPQDSQRHPLSISVCDVIDENTNKEYEEPLNDTWKTLYPQ